MNAQTARKILIVDDSPTERFFMASLLVKEGYEDRKEKTNHLIRLF